MVYREKTKDGTVRLTGSDDSGWQAVAAASMTSPWAPYSTAGDWSGPKFRRRNGIVYLAGLIKAASIPGTNTVIFVLPPGFRPGADNSRGRMQMAQAAGNILRIDIQPGGAVLFYGPATSTAVATAHLAYVSLDQISFIAEQ